MQIIGRTLALAFCVLSAYSLPHLSGDIPNEDGVYQLILAQVRSALIETRAMTPAETACATYYNNRTQQVNSLLTNQTTACFENANKTTSNNNQSANATMAAMRFNMITVQQQLANCSALNVTTQFLNCEINTFDSNLRTLDLVNSQAYMVQAQIAANQSQVDLIRQACVGSAIDSAKTNLTQAANDYNLCLNNVKNQREVVLIN